MSSSSGNNDSFVPAPPRIELKSAADLNKMRVAGQAVGQLLQLLGTKIAPGVTTQQLDDIAFKEIRSIGMKPAFLGYHGYPASTCISINEELVHGIPRSDRSLREGDIVSIDLGVIHDGFYGDAARTYAVGSISTAAQKLIDTAVESLERAMAQARPGNRLGDVSWAVQSYAEKAGYSVVRDYVGHGIGRKMHEDPAVPNFGKPGTGPRLLPGMVIAIEPMINAGDWRVKTLSDGWTVVTEDGKLCAHVEHTVAITDNGNEVLTRI